MEISGEIFEDWLELFVGTYDARNFAKMEEGKNPIRKIAHANHGLLEIGLLVLRLSEKHFYGIKLEEWQWLYTN